MRRLSTRSPLGAQPRLLAGPGRGQRKTKRKQPAEDVHKHRERPSLSCTQRQHATGSEVTAQHGHYREFCVKCQYLNLKLHLAVVNIC